MSLTKRFGFKPVPWAVFSPNVGVWGAFLWSFFEATVFFIIPDVWLSLCGLGGPRVIVKCLAASIAGSMCGAAVLWWLPSLAKFWPALPGYYPLMAEVAAENLHKAGAAGIVMGPSSGIPYRVYIQKAHEMGLDWFALMAQTPVARLSRIALAPIAAWLLFLFAHKLLKKPPGRKFWIGAILTYWVGIYVWYWGFFLPTRYGGVSL
jgi:membrane protein YqaA with SNARE-associated domain